MVLPFFQERRIGAYLLKQKLKGRKHYPLVLMLEPLFRCNLACAGCGKIDYPELHPQPPPVQCRNALMPRRNAALRWWRFPVASR